MRWKVRLLELRRCRRQPWLQLLSTPRWSRWLARHLLQFRTLQGWYRRSWRCRRSVTSLGKKVESAMSLQPPAASHILPKTWLLRSFCLHSSYQLILDCKEIERLVQVRCWLRNHLSDWTSTGNMGVHAHHGQLSQPIQSRLSSWIPGLSWRRCQHW